MERIPAVIMDDEKPACDRLTRILSGFPQIEIKGVFTRTEEGINFILQKKPRVVFLDIEMENNHFRFRHHPCTKSAKLPACCHPCNMPCTVYPQSPKNTRFSIIS